MASKSNKENRSLSNKRKSLFRSFFPSYSELVLFPICVIYSRRKTALCISHVGKTEGEKLDDKRRDDGAGKISNTQKKMQGKLSVVWTFFAMLVWRTLMNKIIMFLRRPATERIKSTLQTVFLLSILVLAWLFWSLCGARPTSKRNGESGRSRNLASRGSGILGIMLTRVLLRKMRELPAPTSFACLGVGTQ